MVLIAAEVVVWFLGLVATDIVGQSSVSIDGLAVVCLYSQHLSRVVDKIITTWSMDFIVTQRSVQMNSPDV